MGRSLALRVSPSLLFGRWGVWAETLSTCSETTILRAVVVRSSMWDFLVFSSHTFFPQLVPNPGPCAGLAGHMRLLTLRVPRDVLWQELQSSVSPQGPLAGSGSGLPPWHSPCSGSSSNDVAKARCAAREKMPLQRCTQAPRAGPQVPLLRVHAQVGATNCAASRDQRPPTLTPKTTRRHRRALSSSGVGVAAVALGGLVEG